MPSQAQLKARFERSRKGGLARAAQRKAAQDRLVRDAEERLSGCVHQFVGVPSRCTKCGEYELDTYVLAQAKADDLNRLVEQWGMKRQWGEGDDSLRRRTIAVMFPATR